MKFDLHDGILTGGILSFGFGMWFSCGIGAAAISIGLSLLLIGIIVLVKGSS